MRTLHCVLSSVIFVVGLSAATPVQVNERESKVVLRGTAYDVLLIANSTQAIPAAVLKLRIVGPKGTNIGDTESTVAIRAGNNRLTASIALKQLPKNKEELVWYRLAYTVTGNGAEVARGIMPLFESIDDFALHVSAPKIVQRGRKFFVRVHTNHPVLSRAVGGVAIKVSIQSSDDEPLVSAAATTDARGYAVISISLGAHVEERDLTLEVHAKRGLIEKEAENELKIGAPSRIMVQTDKPLYQPGEVLHIRALAFGDEHRALASKKLYVEIEDEDGTKVFREERTSSRFGVIALDWSIPERVKLGQYSIKAKTYPGATPGDGDDDDLPETVGVDRRTIRISRYDLPTFVVSAKPDRSYYLEGQKASVEINASYLFGKPVPGAKVRVSRLSERRWDFSKQKWEIDEGESIEGLTDQQGVSHFNLDLSEEFSHLSDDAYQRFRDATYTAYVTDPTTKRTEERRFDVRVTKYPIHVYFVRGGQGQGLPDEFFISTSYADGTAAECNIEVKSIGEDGEERPLATARTNRYGVARIRGAKSVETDEGSSVPLIIVASDRKGARGVAKETIWDAREGHFLTLTTSKTILAQGNAIAAELRSDTDGEVVVELSNEWKTLRSFSVRLRKHYAFINIPYSEEFTGQLVLATANMERGNYWTRSGLFAARSVIYPQNRDLKISLRTDRNEYRPGQAASASVRVSTAEGTEIPSVIGAVIFDKAVEERARIDQDLRGTFGFAGYGGWWYNGLTKLSNLTRADLDAVDTTREVPEDLDVAADFLLNISGNGWGISPVFGDSYEETSLATVYETEIKRALGTLQTAVDQERASGTLPRNRQELDLLLERHGLRWTDVRDPWGSEFIPKFSINNYEYVMELWSPGPDKRADTSDDFNAMHRATTFYHPTQELIARALRKHHEETGGFVRDVDSLRRALVESGADLSQLNDPWGRAYVFSFDVKSSLYTVTGSTHGENENGPGYFLGISGLDYFADERKAIDALVAERFKVSARIPETADEFKNLLMPALRLDELRDPFGRPYFVSVENRARYSSRRLREGQKEKDDPITIWNRLFQIRSAGPDGIPDTPDDFSVAVFSTILSEVDATGNTSLPYVRTMFNGNTGAIGGAVYDQSEAVIAKASVVAINVFTKVEHKAETDEQGVYLLRDLPPGMYDVAIHSTGFINFSTRAVIVLAQETVTLNATLRVGATTETVTVEAAAASVSTESSSASLAARIGGDTPGLAQTVTPRLREYFPETLLWQPAIETDRQGRARINWKFADNLTTWKISLIASTLDGRVATIEKEVRSFQPFFVEHDPPKVLTLGDRIGLPVPVRNYTEKPENVNVTMSPASWFRSSAAAQEASVPANGSTTLVFPYEATAITASGKQRVTAIGGSVSDAIERPSTVHPYGAEITHTTGAILSGTATMQFEIPTDAIPGSIHADLKVYPNLLAHVTESLEGLLQRPYGCGEQTISSTYPSVKLLQFEKQSGQSLGPIHDRAMRYAGAGYTRLLSYAAESGGFTYWGHGEPDLALTAYALRFLHDAAGFVPVDDKVVEHAREWLLSQQKPDGAWVAHRWYTSTSVEDAALTAYIARVLASTRDPKTEAKQATAQTKAILRALDNVAAVANNFDDAYLLASYGLAVIAAGEPARAADAAVRLRKSAENERGGSYWELRGSTPFYGWGRAGRVETTALVIQLLNRVNGAGDAELTDRGLAFLIQQKDRYGMWYSTQTTINVIDSLLLLAARPRTADVTPMRIVVNGAPQALSSSDAKNAGPQIVDLSSVTRTGNNIIEISGGSGLATAQAVTYYYVPWTSPAATASPGPLKLSVSCDRLRLEIGEKATCDVSAERLASAGHGMMLAEIGIPPGVDVDREGLKQQVSESGWDLSAFEVLPDRIVSYVWPRAGGTRFKIAFTPRMAIDAVSAPHTIYDYYNPDASVTVAPSRFVVGRLP